MTLNLASERSQQLLTIEKSNMVKPIKKNILRNNERYDMQQCLDDLYSKSKEGYNFKRLFELIVDEKNLKLAYRNVKSNSGSSTPGVNGHTIDFWEAKTTEDNAEIIAIDMFCTQLQLLSVSFILPALDKLVDEGLTPDMMFHQMSAIGLTRPQQLMLGTALYRYFSDDYVSYLHIAMPLTESIFRDLFANRGYSTTVLSNGTAMNEQVFNTFLDNEYVKRLTPPVLLDMISITMVNQLGLNLRNDIAHGICEEKDYSKTNCGISLLFIMIDKVNEFPICQWNSDWIFFHVNRRFF